MKIDFHLEGAQDCREALAGFAASLLPKAARGMADGLEAMAREARSLAPVDTGELVSSIQAEPVTQEGEEAMGCVRAAADHAACVELGTGHQPARPFLFPACQAHRDTLLQAVAASIREGLP